MVSPEVVNAIVSAGVVFSVGAYSALRLAKYAVVRGLYGGGKIEEMPTILNSARLFKKYIKDLKDKGDRLEGEIERLRKDPSLN